MECTSRLRCADLNPHSQDMSGVTTTAPHRAPLQVLAVDRAVQPPSYAVLVGSSVRETEAERLRLRHSNQPAPPSEAPACSGGAVNGKPTPPEEPGRSRRAARPASKAGGALALLTEGMAGLMEPIVGAHAPCSIGSLHVSTSAASRVCAWRRLTLGRIPWHV